MKQDHEDPSLEKLMQSIGNTLGQVVDEAGRNANRKLGFAFLVFDFGAGGFMTYMSNAEREDMVKVLKEFLAKIDTCNCPRNHAGFVDLHKDDCPKFFPGGLSRSPDPALTAVEKVRARVVALETALRDCIQAFEQAVPRRHSPWCNGVHEGTSCEGDYQMTAFVEHLRKLLGSPAVSKGLPDRVVALEAVLKRFVGPSTCEWGGNVDGATCLLARRPKPCKVCQARAVLSADE